MQSLFDTFEIRLVYLCMYSSYPYIIYESQLIISYIEC